MKNRGLLISCLLLTVHARAQLNGEWTWMSGDDVGGASPNYGVQGTAAATNKPGNRDSQSGWVDPSGNFWIFAGDDNNANTLNDLWKYSPSSGLWTWVSGNSSPNSTGSYGVKGVTSAGNLPQARFGQAVTVDPSGNFWVFGGASKATLGTTTMLNDLWKYNATTNLWTWISGDSAPGQSGIYGTQGTAAAANKPGGRIYPSLWADASGNIWVFAGLGFDGAGTLNNLNDLWKYNPSTGQWTWMSGSNTANASGVYGTKGTAAAANVPGARNASSAWKDAHGNFWVFGGATGAFFDNSGGAAFDDLWKYSASTNQWTWVGGDNTTNVAGVYGTQGMAAAANKPGARYAQSVSVDPSGNFWLFGGFDAGTGSRYNDLWMYMSSVGQWIWVGGSSGFNAAAFYGTEGIPGPTVTPSGRGFQSMWVDAASNIWVSSGYDGGNDNNDLFKWSIVTPLAVRSIILSGRQGPYGNDLSWDTYGEVNTAYFDVERSSDGVHFGAVATVQAIGTGDNGYTFDDDGRLPAGALYYRVKAVGLDSSGIYSNIIALESRSTTGAITVYPNPTRGSVSLQIAGNTLLNTPLKLFTLNGRLVAELQLTSSTQTVDLSMLPPAVYLLQLANGTTIRIVKIL